MDTIQFAVAAAVHAPSVHNTQPWRFGRGERDIGVTSQAGAGTGTVRRPVGEVLL